ncbi:DUF6364 family protein [Dyadobacter subterraneus]|uniref:CopG family transcriptional regulator n=1 Tax=Dyadobacter subterraneus TaxID=2773304 RepID=A0ABR9WD44_9BACT|nr:DUF6364 family protein [Dyadobacter subterraneus]MBE9462901.1 hypothetical protein [Dyadobacter subterraneus]
MDAKITLSFDEQVILDAKEYANANGISLSRLTEFLFRKIVSGQFKELEDFPVSDWVTMLSEGEVEYTKSKKSKVDLKKDFYESKR